MAGAPNPFAAVFQPLGAAGPVGRGRGRGRGGSQPSPTPFHANASSAPRDPKASDRGRGRGTFRGRGRGAGPASKTWRKPESATAAPNNGLANGSVGSTKPSPFAQLKQNTPSPSPFGQPSPQSFSAFGKASPASFASSSNLNATKVDFSRDPRKQNPSKPTFGKGINGNGSAVAVEDLSVLSSYTERYEQLKIERARERERAIKAGQMADPNQPTNLNQAITPVGTCTSMCPEFERVERIVQKMVDKSEKFLHPSTNSLQNMESKMLKRFRRSAAGYDEQLPSDIRTPKTLLQTMNYLIRHVLGGPEPLGLIHKFVWDRTRSIRNDLSVQQLTQEDHVRMAVTCLERIARFHIVSLHLLSSPANEEQFDRHQEREQLNNTMLSLMYYYDDNRDRIRFPNEDEFRAYYIVFSIHDQRPDLEARVQKWPAELRNSPQVKLALELLATAGNTWEYQGTLDAKRPNAIAQGFYARFFSLVDSPAVSYLLACVAEIYFNHLRQTAIRSIWKGYCRYPQSQQHKNDEWTVEELTTVLYFDDDSQTVSFCEEQDLSFAENDNGDLYLNWGSRNVDLVAFQPSSEHSFSEKYVEVKRGGRTLVAVILGLNIQEAANLGMIDSSYLSERLSALDPIENTPNDDSLFVSDEGNEIPAPSLQPNGFFTQNSSSHQSPSPVPETTNVFGMPSQASAPTEPSPPLAPFSYTPSTTPPPQPPQNNNAFSSLFAPAGTSAPASTAFGASSSNPFASLHQPSTVAAAPTPSPFSFPTAPPSQQSPFTFPTGAPEASKADSKEKLQTESKEAPTIASTNSLFNTSSVFPAPPTSAPSPFATPATTTGSQLGGASSFAVKESTASVFDTVKTPSLGSSASSFSLFKPSTEPSTTSSQQDQKPVQEAPPPPEPSVVFPPPPKQNDTPKKPLFSFQPLAPLSNAQPDKPVEATGANEEPQEHPLDDTASLEKVTATDPSLTDQSVSLLEEDSAPKISPPPSENKTEVSTLFSLPAPVTTDQRDAGESEPLPTEPVVEEKLLNTLEEAGQDGNWVEALRAAAESRRRTSSTSRKRALDDQERKQPVESGAKPSKVSKPAAPVRKKKSMALSSIKPLPKLPILEQVESMIAKKPAVEEKPNPPKPNHLVDEDELLLSAARIAAESLRSGPKLSDSWSTPPETRRSSFSPHTSVMSPMSFSRSQSPHSSSVYGYDMARAPDSDLGLGRTLSRTEQRLRLTGGKGLAYKPLDFTPKKQRKSK